MSDIFDHYGDAMDDLMLGRTADEGAQSFSPTVVKCKFCGAEDLAWREVGDRWRLFSGKELHTCSAYSISVGRVTPKQS